ncbi:MAG: SWIM zinc finger family protein, partial [Deltaproteobacteria bacterium]|nr:SWIM zinc finger family protein [Deltaproteobacteria bacterium]
GRSYVRHGAVLDLQIDPGKVESLVQGTRSKPYSVVIKIEAVNKMIWQDIKAACEGKLDSLQELLAGKFPKALNEIFMAQGKGLFPSPKEIDFNCSCPDWAYMCKHVAATLYGIGARLDKDPSLFFKLRKAKMKDLVTQAVEDKTRKLLKKAKKKTTRVIEESDLADVFGIDIEEPVAIMKNRAKAPKRASSRKKSLMSASKKTKARAATGKPGAKTPPKKASPKIRDRSLFDTVEGIIKKSKKGITAAGIREKTGLDEKQIRNIVYKAKKQGRIKNLKRGVYIPA